MKYSLSKLDWIKSLVMAALVPAIYIIQSSLAAGEMKFNLKEIGIAACSGMVAYLIKNFFTDSVKQAEKIIASNEPIKP